MNANYYNRGEQRAQEGSGPSQTRWEREPMMAREIMTTNVKSVMRTTSLQEIAQIMKSENCGIIPEIGRAHV